MSSQRDSSNYFKGSSRFSSDGGSQAKLPDDLETARAIIESLTRQLKIHDDVTSNLLLLQKRIQHTHQRTQDAMRMLEDRLDNIEATWTKELEDQHKRWLDKYNRLVREAENTCPLKKVSSKASVKHSIENVKISKQQLESLNRRVKKVDEGIGELEKVVDCTKNFDEKLRLDKQKIRDIDARVMIELFIEGKKPPKYLLNALTKKEQKLNIELTKQMNIHFRKPFLQMTDERSEKSLYGVCEVIDGYKKTIENLDEALRTLEQIKSAPAMKSIKSPIQSTPSVDEIDEITILMKRFLAKLHVQLESVHLHGNQKSSTQVGIDKNALLMSNNSDFKSGKSKEITTSTSPNRGTTSGFDPTPLNTSQSVPTGSPTSSAHSQFMVLKSEVGREGMITAKEKSEQILSDKKK